MSPPQTHAQPDTHNPFALEPGEYPFLEAQLIQCVASPAHLHWETGGGGFFIEAEAPPLEHFIQATLITGAGKRVPGFAAGTFLFFPVAARTRWESGKPGNRLPVSEYVEGARSRTIVLAVLETGQWVKLTTSGLASKHLAQAFRDHRYAQARQQRQPFAVALSGVAGAVEQVKGTMVTPFQFVTLSDEACPVALGWTIRERWDEVVAWRGMRPSQSPTPLDGAAGEILVYGNGESVADNPAEGAAFRAYQQAEGQLPSDRDALRAWYQEQNGSPA